MPWPQAPSPRCLALCFFFLCCLGPGAFFAIPLIFGVVFFAGPWPRVSSARCFGLGRLRNALAPTPGAFSGSPGLVRLFPVPRSRVFSSRCLGLSGGVLFALPGLGLLLLGVSSPTRASSLKNLGLGRLHLGTSAPGAFFAKPRPRASSSRSLGYGGVIFFAVPRPRASSTQFPGPMRLQRGTSDIAVSFSSRFLGLRRLPRGSLASGLFYSVSRPLVFS